MSARQRMLYALMSGSGGAQIGPDAVGAPGSGIFAGMTLVAGRDFATASIPALLASAANPTGPLHTTRVYASGAGAAYVGGQRAPATGPLNVMHDPDPAYTGWNDSNRGVPMTFDNGAPHQIVVADGAKALRLHTCRQSTAEQALLTTGVSGQVERGAMVHSQADFWWCAPAAVNVRAAIPTGPRGWHPTTWALQISPAYTYNGNEYGWECNGQSNTNAYEDSHANGATSAVAGVDLGLTYRDGLFHDLTIVESVANGNLVHYVDRSASPVATNAVSPTTHGVLPAYWLATSHVYAAAFGGANENYVAADWAAAGAAGANLDIRYVQVWVPTGGKCYKPAASIPDQLVTPGQSFSYTIPSAATLWGSGVTDIIMAMPVEAEEPGNTQSGWTGAAAGAGFPAWLTLTGRTLSGTVPAVGGGVGVSGALKVVVGYCPAGNACNPAVFRIVVAPAFIGTATQNLTNGSPATIDVYAMFDCGRELGKTLTCGTPPTGMSFSATTGLITGTPTVSGTTTPNVSCANADGQTTTQALSIVVAAAAGGVAAPAVTGTLTASWDPGDTSKLTLNGSSVTAMAGSDSTSVTLANAGTLSTCPTLVTRNGKQQLRFTSSSLQFLQVASALGLQGNPVTLVVIFEHATTAASQVVLDISAGNGNLGVNRHLVISSTTTGINYRKSDSGGATCTASVGTVVPTGIQLAVTRATTGSSAGTLNVNGVGTAVAGTPVSSGPTSLATVTLGDSRETNAQAARYLDGWVARVLVYATALSDADVESIAVWATTNYGTTNAA